MAIVWGKTVNDRWRVGIEITQTASTSSTVTLKAEYFFWARYNISDSNNSFSASGSFGSTSGSKPVSTGTSGGTISLGSQSKTFNRAYGSTSSASQSISFSGLEAIGATLTASASYSIPRRSYSAPPAPSITSKSLSGTTGRIGWTNNHSTSSSSATYASGLVVNWYYMGADGSLIDLGTHTRGNTSTTDSYTIPSGRAFAVGIYARNADAASTSTPTGWVYPTPAAPTGISNTRNSDSQNTVRWTPKAPNLPNTNIIVQRSVNGAAFSHYKTLPATASSFVDTTTLAGNSHRYRVRTEYGDKYSSWTTSGTTYNTPTAPSITNVVRNSDTKYTISFKTNAPSRTGTYTLIERYTGSSGAWAQIAKVSPTATSYIDRGTTTNNHYRYRVRTVYGNAYSGYVTSDVYSNTPAKPSNVRAAKNADNSVTVSWTDNARTETGFSLQRSQDAGATWVTVTSSISYNSTSYTDTAAPGGSLSYRVEAHRDSLRSGWSASSTSITTIAPPKAPTMTGYPRATVSTEDGGFTIKWLHNPVDGSAQSIAQVEITDPAGIRTWTDLTSDTNTYTIDNISAGTYKVRVATRGAHADWSPFSSQVAITVAVPPQVVITAPATDGEVITALPYTTSWAYEDAGYNPVSVDYYIQRQEEDDSWTTVYRDQTVAGNGSVTLDASTIIPRNGQTYRVHIWARATSGLTTTADRVFTTDYEEPAQPVVTVEHDSDKLSTSVLVEEFGSDIVDRNLVLDSDLAISTDEYLVRRGYLSEPWEEGATYTVTIKGTVNTPNYLTLWRDAHSIAANSEYDSERGVYSATFVCPPGYPGRDPYEFSIYNFPQETATSASIEWIKIEHGSVATDWTPAPEEGVIMPVSYTVLRITDEDEVMLATDLVSGGVVDDPIRPLNKAYTYRIISHAESGAISEQDVPAYVNTTGTFAINYGPGFTKILLARFNTTLDTDVTKEQKLQEYEGRVYPVLYEGRRRDLSISLSTQIDKTLVRDWDGLDSWAGVCILRTPDGLRLPVKERHSISTEYNNPVATIDIEMTRIDYELG